MTMLFNIIHIKSHEIDNTIFINRQGQQFSENLNTLLKVMQLFSCGVYIYTDAFQIIYVFFPV